MNSHPFLHRVIGVMLVLMFLAGCGALTAMPTPTPSRPAQPNVQSGQSAGQAGTCSGSDVSTQGIPRSTDHGAT